MASGEPGVSAEGQRACQFPIQPGGEYCQPHPSPPGVGLGHPPPTGAPVARLELKKEPAALREYPTLEIPPMLGRLIECPHLLPLATARNSRGWLGDSGTLF